MNIVNIIVMVLIGAVSGTLAARIMKGGDHYGFVVNALLGIAGAVVGGIVFDFLNLNPGKIIVDGIYDTFGVSLPPKIIGTIITAIIGAILILWIAQLLGGERRRRYRRRR